MRDLLDLVGAPPGSDVRVTSLQTRGAFGRTTMPARFADDPSTLLALRLNGEELSIDHGYPCRVIAPDRPGVLQTKWVHLLEVVT
jgi:DMSO/TMAO reductase YedYZ molybdopterin-dependent catalytic subunit